MQSTNTVESDGGSRPRSYLGNVVSAVLGVIGFALLWVWSLNAGVGEGNVAKAFLDVPSVLLVLVGPLAILTAIYGWAGVIDAFLWVFRKPNGSEVAGEAVTFFQLGAAFSLASGFLGTVVGLVIMLTNLDSPARIGPGLATALLAQLYGVFAAVACIALAAHIARRHQGVALTIPITRQAAGIAGITVIAGTFTAMIAFCILMLSVSPGL